MTSIIAGVGIVVVVLTWAAYAIAVTWRGGGDA